MDKEKDKKNNDKSFSALSLAWELGYSIALPLVLFALLGRWLDHKFGTAPGLLLVGVFLSIATSGYLVYKKMMEIIK